MSKKFDYDLKKISKKCKKILKESRIDKNDCRYEKSQKFYKKYGFFHEECWNLDTTLAALILPRLIEFKESNVGCPGRFCQLDEDYNVINEEEAVEKWEEVLDKMIEAFYRILFEDKIIREREERIENDEAIKRGLELFSEHFLGLWW